MNRLSSMTCALLAGTVLAVAPAVAQNSGSEANYPSPNASAKSSAGTPMSKTEFVKKVAQSGMAEVELGRLAQQKATSSEVKQFAERMVNDHSKANDQLKQLADKEHLNLPQTVDKKDKMTKARLEKLSGEKFDHAYMADMVKDHKKDISEFQLESKNLQDPELKSFVDQTLPTLRDHLKQAEKTAATTSTKQTSQARMK